MRAAMLHMPKIDVGKNKVGARFSRWRENDRKREKSSLFSSFLLVSLGYPTPRAQFIIERRKEKAK